MKNVIQIINGGFERELGIEESINNRNFELVEKLFSEGGTYRIYTHLKEDDKWAIVSPYTTDEDNPDKEKEEIENKKKMKKLKEEVRGFGYGFNELRALWSYPSSTTGEMQQSEEYSLIIYGMGKEKAMRLGKKYEQTSVIVKEGDTVQEICTTPTRYHSVGDVINTFDVGGKNVLNIKKAEDVFNREKEGSASVPVKGNRRPFTLQKNESVLEAAYTYMPPRASYFQTEGTYYTIYERKEN